MSQPQHKNYSITVLVVEGIKTASKIIATPRGITERQVRFESPVAALEWCQKHGASMLYSPRQPESRN